MTQREKVKSVFLCFIIKSNISLALPTNFSLIERLKLLWVCLNLHKVHLIENYKIG